MISRQYSERTKEANSTGRREIRQGIKKRSILPSFGDIVLPIVSVAAVGLLVLAGRQFFINGLKTSPGITTTRAYADAPALIAEREQEVLPPVAEVKPDASTESAEVHAEIELAVAEPSEIVKVSLPAKPQPTAKKTPAKAQALPLSKQWRVQVGAYGSKAAAQEAANKIKKAGYKTEVYSNPASKHVKVWVYSGGDKASANKVVEAMKKLGYKSSFAFPPAK